MDGWMDRWKTQMEKHIYTHAHESKAKHEHTHTDKLQHGARCRHVFVCVCEFAISLKNENYLADGKAQSTLARGVCEPSLCVYVCV